MSTTYLADRAVIRLSPTAEGEDVRGFLNGLVTNDLKEGMAGMFYCGLLSPQGKCLFDFIVAQEYAPVPNPQSGGGGLIRTLFGKGSAIQWHLTNDWLIDCEAAEAEALVKRLSMYRLRRAIDIKIDPQLCVYWHGNHWNDFPDPRTPLWPSFNDVRLGHRVIGKSDPSLVDGSAEFRAKRLSFGIPEGATEMRDILWLETNAAELNGVSFTKGCYVGQENTARMNWRSKVNRRLVVVPLGQSDEKRRRVAYPDLGLAVDHLRVEDMTDLPLPEWQRAAISAASETDSGD